MRRLLAVMTLSVLIAAALVGTPASAQEKSLREREPKVEILREEPGPKTVGPSAVALTILDADGKPAADADVHLYSELEDSIVWTGKSNPQGHVTVKLDADIARRQENIVDTNFTIRVFLNDQMTVHHLGFPRVKDPSGMSPDEIKNYMHPQKYLRILHLERMKLVPMERPDASAQVQDVLDSTYTTTADTKIGQVSLANGLIATFYHQNGSSLQIDGGYKKEGQNWEVKGTYSKTTSASTATTLTYPYTGTAGAMCDYYSGTCYEAYALNVIAPFSYQVNRYKHWLDVEGANFGWYWDEIVPKEKGFGGYFDEYNWMLSYNNRTPSGSTGGYCQYPTGCKIRWDYASGDKWAVAFEVPAAGGTFLGGVAKSYYQYTYTEISTGTGQWPHTRYDFYDWDGTKRNWYVKAN